MTEKKHILLTGTSRGLGLELARHYLESGFLVTGMSRSNADIDDKNYHHINCDIAIEPEVIASIKKLKRERGAIDVLVNNAGIASMNHFSLTPGHSVNSIFGTNVFASIILCREVGKIMIRQKRGRIVNLSTVAVPLSIEGEAVYSASKAALEQYTKVVSKELAPHGVTANIIGPSPIPTKLIENIPEEKIRKILDQQAIKKFASIEDITNVIDFFIDDRSKFITGQTIYLGGVS